MIGQCAAPREELGLVRSLLDTVDCNIREGVQGGYAAFFGPGSALSLILTTLLTLYVAVLGFRLLTGRTDLRVADLPMIAIKLGAVVLLTTSWASYQTLVFDLLFDAPAEISNTLLASMPLPQGPAGVPADIWARLQRTFDALTQAAAALAVSEDPGSSSAPAPNLVLQAAPGTDPASLQGLSPIIQMRSALQGGPAFGATALWLSAITLLVSTLGIVILAKLMLGLLLALGPLFVGLLLFDTTKGFFEGWLRTALGFALVPLATIVFLAGMLASLEPSIAGLEAARAEGRFDLEPVLTVMVIVLTFTAVFASILGMCTRLVAGFRLPQPAPRPADPAPSMDADGRLIASGAAGSADLSRAERLAASVAGATGAGRDGRAQQTAAGAAASAAALGAARISTTSDRRTEILSQSGPSDAGRGDASERLGQIGRRRSNVVRRGLPAVPPRPAGVSS